MFLKVLFMVLVLFSPLVYADEIIVHLRSHHATGNHDRYLSVVDDEGYQHDYYKPGHNNNNFGLSYQFDNGFTFGYYKNSKYRYSVYFGEQFMFNEYIGVFGGLVTGYRKKSDNQLMPFLSGVIKIPLDDKVGLMLTIIPKTDFSDYVVSTLSVTFKF